MSLGDLLSRTFPKDDGAEEKEANDNGDEPRKEARSDEGRVEEGREEDREDEQGHEQHEEPPESQEDQPEGDGEKQDFAEASAAVEVEKKEEEAGDSKNMEDVQAMKDAIGIDDGEVENCTVAV